MIFRDAVRTVAAPILSFVRRGRVVAWTPEWMGFGNVLLLAHWAVEGRRHGHERWILVTAVLSPWLEVFPGLRSVALTRRDVRFTDRRVMPWSASAREQRASDTDPSHSPIEMSSVEHFISHLLVPGSDLALKPSVDPACLVVNVRRGDYYSNPEIRLQYGFDVLSYVRAAVEGSIAQDGAPNLITVVSDDLDWCRRELGWLNELAPTVFHVSSGAVSDFGTVSSARRIVITNSTFSYWAAYFSNVLHGDNHAQVWAPRFFDRTQNGGRSWLLDERWSVVEGLAHGWDLGVGAGDKGQEMWRDG